MTDNMMKLIKEMKALELTLGHVDPDNHVNLYYESAYSIEETVNITEELKCFQNTTDLYEIGFDTNKIKYA